MKRIGILLGVASLPSRFGIGDFGPNAYKFANWLVKEKYNLWQVLPLNPLGFGNSPYQPYSSFAGDELYISPEQLVKDGLLAEVDLADYQPFSSTIDYIGVRKHKEQFLAKAYAKFNNGNILKAEYNQFIKKHSWVFNYAVFLTFKKLNNFKPWNLWQKEHKDWIKNPTANLSQYQSEIDYELFIQFIFYQQWQALKAYTNSLGIEIMGDIPIYLGFDSLDVWQNQELFLLDENQNPTHIAGVPPDYFSKTGQRWGNPIYNWEKLAKTNFKFWVERLRGNMQMFDIIRIDHFRAFDTYWKIPASCPTAIEGEWIEAPGYALFDTIYHELPDINIVVEDLGDLRPEVLELRDHYKLPGMQVFQFVFNALGDNTRFETLQNCVVYSGTHDNSTLLGWYLGQKKWQRKQIKRYFKATERNIIHKILRYIRKCQANYIVFAMQDILELDDSARINYPGKIGSPNWEWKLISSAFMSIK